MIHCVHLLVTDFVCLPFCAVCLQCSVGGNDADESCETEPKTVELGVVEQDAQRLHTAEVLGDNSSYYDRSVM